MESGGSARPHLGHHFLSPRILCHEPLLQQDSTLLDDRRHTAQFLQPKHSQAGRKAGRNSFVEARPRCTAITRAVGLGACFLAGPSFSLEVEKMVVINDGNVLTMDH